MKNKFFWAILTLILTIQSPFSYAANLYITITNIKNTNGNIRVGLSNSASDFPNNEYTGKSVEIKSDTVDIEFAGLPSGTYAIAAYHDENNNKKLDKNLFGIPREGYCFSNNEKGKSGPAKFNQAKFSLDTTEKQTLKMRY